MERLYLEDKRTPDTKIINLLSTKTEVEVKS